VLLVLFKMCFVSGYITNGAMFQMEAPNGAAEDGPDAAAENPVAGAANVDEGGPEADTHLELVEASDDHDDNEV
jgi:hypothetical protein